MADSRTCEVGAIIATLKTTTLKRCIVKDLWKKLNFFRIFYNVKEQYGDYAKMFFSLWFDYDKRRNAGARQVTFDA
jgi:hypothetical protein